MSVIVKSCSAFTPVNKTRHFNHPFSIKNILNLDEDDSSDSKPKDIGSRVIRLPQPVQDLPLPYDNNAAIPSWIYATRYCRQGIPLGTFVNVRKPRKSVKKHKQRPLFSQKQIQRLEEEFSSEKYISKSRRSTLAAEISLTDAQVRTWFQNRRTRWRKEAHSEDEICLSDIRHPWQIPNKQEHGSNTLIVRGYCCS
ncbi:homeobox protein ceh-9 [Exaiptasia diaphana]|uniref:Homeobox domain-containing protein n=1 Tax=Exaiptasia diaphana TaxID=2652724 RepID=A0A913YC25_EXADI|nr:homeobox protein ceh-9 [Exaiptasia diaphana]